MFPTDRFMTKTQIYSRESILSPVIFRGNERLICKNFKIMNITELPWYSYLPIVAGIVGGIIGGYYYNKPRRKKK